MKRAIGPAIRPRTHKVERSLARGVTSSTAARPSAWPPCQASFGKDAIFPLRLA